MNRRVPLKGFAERCRWVERHQEDQWEHGLGAV